MLSSEEAGGFIESVSMIEIEGALRSFKNDKSPGLDGWPIEFFIHFFDLMGRDLLQDVEYSRKSGRIAPSLNSTFLALIHKKDKPTTFVDFRPISLCNLIYNLISKIIVVRLKPHLDSHISMEQFAFLKNCQIVEPIGITQEILHTVKTKNTRALILKLDLVKAFDRVNLYYIRLILIQIGVPLMGVN